MGHEVKLFLCYVQAEFVLKKNSNLLWKGFIKGVTGMNEDVYKRLARVLDTLPNGFPPTESGLELDILKKIFTPDEADLFCDLKLKLEPLETIAERTGRDKDILQEMLTSMSRRGEILGLDLGGTKLYRMVPWILGVYEYQLPRMDRELAELCEQYHNYFAPQFFGMKPHYMQVIPVEEEISPEQEALTYLQASEIIEKGKSFAVAECVCKKEKALLGKGCDKPREVCLGIAPLEGIMEQFPHWGTPISKQRAHELLKEAEDAGLVHLTLNSQQEHFFICNCCGCCCGVLRSINELGIFDSVNTWYYAQIDPELCIMCGVCKDERCQVFAIEQGEESYLVDLQRCIGCGLCVSTCPSGAISLVKKQDEQMDKTPVDEQDWFKQRGEQRGVEIDPYL